MLGVLKTIKYTFNTNNGSRFRRNFLKIAKANIFAQLLSIIFLPILTRLYTPDEYGVLALFTSLLGFIAAFATFRLDWSIPNASSKNQAKAFIGCWELIQGRRRVIPFRG